MAFTEEQATDLLETLAAISTSVRAQVAALEAIGTVLDNFVAMSGRNTEALIVAMQGCGDRLGNDVYHAVNRATRTR